MKTEMKHCISVESIRLYAYHGCLPEERIIGSDYLVDVKVQTDMSKAALSDQLEDAVDYVRIHSIVEEEMKIPANLLEEVVLRIIKKIEREFPEIEKKWVKVCKCTPPINGDVERVCVAMGDF